MVGAGPYASHYRGAGVRISILLKRVVGATGIEPVTPTMSTYHKIKKIND